MSVVKAAALLVIASLLWLSSGSTSSVSSAQRPPTTSDEEREQTPTFASLAGERGTVSIDAALTAEDLAAIVEGDPQATKCSDALIRAQWQQDLANRLFPAAHFDNCQIEASLQYLREEYASANAAAATGDVFRALRHLGHALHSIGDFYAHTNFVELAAERAPELGAQPALVLWDDSINTTLKPFKPRLVSGRLFKEALWDSGACPKGTPTHKAMNKDSPESERGRTLVPSWGMTHYRATLELTKAACRKLLRDTMKRPAWSAVVRECGPTYGFGLRADIRKE